MNGVYPRRLRENAMKKSDTNIVEAILAGDREAFGELVQRYGEALTATAYAHTGDREASRDIAQEVFIEAYRRLGTLAEPEKFAAWAHAICRNHAISWVRHRTVQRQGLAREAEAQRQHAPGDQPPMAAIQNEEHLRIMAAMEDMAENDRQIILLRYAGGLGRAETARMLGITPEAADKRLQRAVKKLREKL
ncbi:MAG: sigma-70 family RNA polymerase sigma factor [Planctomycetes bacterium]|nr:sigma-70 family RNA polymerase sigma factor [Planctomycetota bacterium]